MKRKRNINTVWHPIEEFYSSGFPVRMVTKSRLLWRGALAPTPTERLFLKDVNILD